MGCFTGWPSAALASACVITLHEPVAAAGSADDPPVECPPLGVVPEPGPLVVVDDDELHAARAAMAASAAAVIPILAATILNATSPPESQ